jgi:hypothetical protein
MRGTLTHFEWGMNSNLAGIDFEIARMLVLAASCLDMFVNDMLHGWRFIQCEPEMPVKDFN